MARFIPSFYSFYSFYTLYLLYTLFIYYLYSVYIHLVFFIYLYLYLCIFECREICKNTNKNGVFKEKMRTISFGRRHLFRLFFTCLFSSFCSRGGYYFALVCLFMSSFICCFFCLFFSHQQRIKWIWRPPTYKQKQTKSQHEN